MLKYKLKRPITIDDKVVKELDLKEECDVDGPSLFSVVNPEDRAQRDVIAFLTGLSSKDIHQIKPVDYAGLLEHVGKLLT